MVDVHSAEQRSRNMAAIRSKNTSPEIRVRSALHALGFRFRLHKKGLPGKPDIVLQKHRTAIFVHGCFWHSHECRYGAVTPATRPQFWADKRYDTILRDERKSQALRDLGWRVITVWECETKNPEALRLMLVQKMNEVEKLEPAQKRRATNDPKRIKATDATGRGHQALDEEAR